MQRPTVRLPFRLAGALAVAGGLLFGVAHNQPPQRDQRLLPFRFPELSDDGRTLTVSIVADICGDFDGLTADLDDETITVAAHASKPSGSFCEGHCAINYHVTRVATITFDAPVSGLTLVEQPGTPLACADGLGEPIPEQPVSWLLTR